jgi:hypothetical protein
MLTASPCFVMSSVGLFKCRQPPCKIAGTFTGQFALRENALIADCNQRISKNRIKPLFLKDLSADTLLARRLLCLFYQKEQFGASCHEQHPLACKRSGFGFLARIAFFPKG